jgi:hypothetical protein
LQRRDIALGVDRGIVGAALGPARGEIDLFERERQAGLAQGDMGESEQAPGE